MKKIIVGLVLLGVVGGGWGMVDEKEKGITLTADEVRLLTTRMKDLQTDNARMGHRIQWLQQEMKNTKDRSCT